MISRRALLGGAIAMALAARLAAEARAAARPWRIGWLDNTFLGAYREAPFVTALKQKGYAEGSDFVLEVRHAEGQFDRLPTLAAELVRDKADVIVAYGDPAIGAAKAATAAIPIVMLNSADPVGLGFVASLNRPGGNITGVSDIAADLAAKQLDFLKQAVPQLHRVLVLTNATVGAKERTRQQTLHAAQALQLSMMIEEVRDLPAAERIFASLKDRRPDGIVVVGGQLLDGPTRIGIAKLALQLKLPLASDTTFMIP